MALLARKQPSGKPFAPGHDPRRRPGPGRPKGVPDFNVHRILGGVLVGQQERVQKAILAAFESESQTFRGLELAAKLNHELTPSQDGTLPVTAIQFNMQVQAAPGAAPTTALEPVTFAFSVLPTNGSANGHGH